MFARRRCDERIEDRHIQILCTLLHNENMDPNISRNRTSCWEPRRMGATKLFRRHRNFASGWKIKVWQTKEKKNPSGMGNIKATQMQQVWRKRA